MALDDLRLRLNEIDGELLELIAERQRVVADISADKLARGAGTRDYAREKRVIDLAQERAVSLGLDPQLARDIMGMLIQISLSSQEQARVAAQGAGNGRSALVIGGAGNMGQWFADFLNSQGFGVTIADPVPGDRGYPRLEDWRDSDLDQDIVVVAVPLGHTASVLEAIAERRPRGLVMDVGSLKSPLRTALKALTNAGVQVCSIHPMFGPDTQLLSGRHMIFVDLGVEGAVERARSLFAATMAEQIVMDLDEHDRLIAYVLGLSHALNIAFFTALAESGELVPRLAELSSTTFDAQLRVASLVARENPQMYYEIQALNEYGGQALTALTQASEKVARLVGSGDRDGFVALMEAGRDYLSKRPAER